MTAPSISVVITTYNRPAKLLRCIKAVAEQTQAPHETIIVNDGSAADYTECKRYIAATPNMKWIEQTNQGVSAARNNGVDMSQGAFIAFCDDDDYWLPHHVETLHAEITRKNGTPGIYHTFRKELNGEVWTDPTIHIKPPNITWQEHYVTKGEMILCCTCIHRDAAKASPFPVGEKYAEDHEQRLVALNTYPCFPIHERTVVIDRTDESATNRSIHEIAETYRNRLSTIFNLPEVSAHVRPKFRNSAKFRWTSLELSEASKHGSKKFRTQWIRSIQEVRTLQNAKTLILHLIWHIREK